jgi:DNA-binding LacI/PurR family transcriptional regulator
MVEGIIFTGGIQSSKKAIKEVIDKQMPVVMIERPLDMAGVDKVLIDDMAGSAAAADAFLAMGHKTMGFIGEKPGSQRVEHGRFYGFKQALEKNNRPLKDQLIVFVRDYTVECGYDAMKRLIEQNGKNRPTACLITADTLACGALQYLYDAKLRVPEDISVIGYDNTLSTFCSPPITAVALPYNEIGDTAVSLFWERQEQNRRIDKTVQLSPFIVDRGSVADIRNNREKQTTH